MSENRSMIKMIYSAVIEMLTDQGAYKGNNYSVNEYRTKLYSGSQKKRTSRPKKKFHRQLKRSRKWKN